MPVILFDDEYSLSSQAIYNYEMAGSIKRKKMFEHLLRANFDLLSVFR
jgi:hypothetical protein